jgi:drug/metabolite transporter (DMT)-like permease
MYVPLVPLLQWLCLGRIPGLMSCIGILLAFIGLILLAGPDGNMLALGKGEIITLVGAVAIAAEIILISAWAGKVDVRRVTVVQLLTASLVAFAAMARPENPFRISAATGAGSGAGHFQRDYSGHHELGTAQRLANPRYGYLYRGTGVGGYIWPYGGRTLAAAGYSGGVFIVVGVLVSELKLKRKRRR